MITELTNTELDFLLKKQLNGFFNFQDEILLYIDRALEKIDYCFSNSRNKYYGKNGQAYFTPYHSGQYSIFLYFLSNLIYLDGGNPDTCSQIYYLNKIMNSVDLYYEVKLPDIFGVDHPLGRVNYELSEKTMKSREFSRSLFVVEDIKAGEVFTEKNVRSIRPGYGVSPKYIKDILGKRALRDIKRGEPLSWDVVIR